MRRRLRKKLHLAEFQALGFRVQARLEIEPSEKRIEELIDALIDLVESRGMSCGGGSARGDVSFYFERMPQTCTDPDRAAIDAWFRSRPEFSTVEVGPFQDMYYMAGPRRRG